MFYKDLRYFVTASQCKSIAEAAEKLYISRQALSLTLRRFEEEVGARLFERDTRGICLTEQGAYFYGRCEVLLKEYEEALSYVRRMANQKETLRIAFSLIALKSLTADAVLRFEKTRPGVTLAFSTMISADAWEALLQGKLDFVCTIRPPEELGFKSRLVKRGTPLLLVAQNSPLALKQRITLADLAGQVLLNSSELEQFTLGMHKEKNRLQYRFFTNDPVLISEAIVNGLGVYAIPRETFSDFQREGIVPVPFEEKVLDLNLYLTCRDPKALSATAREFADYLCSLGENGGDQTGL